MIRLIHELAFILLDYKIMHHNTLVKFPPQRKKHTPPYEVSTSRKCRSGTEEFRSSHTARISTGGSPGPNGRNSTPGGAVIRLDSGTIPAPSPARTSARIVALFPAS